MFLKAKDLRGLKLRATDGDIGKVEEFLFDDRFWTVRYLVADTGGWLSTRQVLISPYALGSVDGLGGTISVDLTKSQVEGSPPLDTDKPVSRQFEESYSWYYGWPQYWGGTLAWGAFAHVERAREHWDKVGKDEHWDVHLRSTNGMDGYGVHAKDGNIGHVEDFIIDEKTWTIRYLVVGTRNWWPSKKVVIPPQWIDSISWADSKVVLDLTQDAVRNSPEFTEESLLTREYETSLHGHYNRRGYWDD